MSTTQLDARGTLTALFFGFVVGTVLFGVGLLESYRYFKSYKDDHIKQKLLVALLIGLDTLHFAFSMHVSYYYLVASLGDTDAINRAIWSVKALGTVQVVLLWLVQCLYLTRIWNLTRMTILHRRLELPVMCAVIVIGIVGFGAGLVFITELDRIEYILDFTRAKWVVYLAFGVSALIDVAIASIMVLLLHRSITGIKRTDGVLSALIHYFFSTGLLTSLAAVTYIIMFAARPQTALYLGMTFLISRLYTISFLELLNMRNQLRENLDDTVELGGFSSLKFMVSPTNASHESGFFTPSEPSPTNTGGRLEEMA